MNFEGLGKLKNHLVKIYSDDKIKPIAVPQGVIPYHLN